MTRLIAWGLAARRTLRRSGDGLAVAAERVRAWEAGPTVLVVAGALVVWLVLSSLSERTFAHVLDEDLFKQSAVHYASDGMPGALFHDVFARGSARLYSLLLSPFFRVFDGDVAVRGAHVFSTLLFVSAAWPAYRLARIVVRSRWLAATAGLAAVAAPWAAMATTLYSENLAYPLFLWAILAMWHAVETPSPRRDLLVLVAIAALGCTRVQFAALLVPWVAVVVVRELGPQGQHRLRYGWFGAVRQLVRAYPFTSAVLALAVLGFLYRWRSGALHEDAQRVLGGYSEIQDRKVLGQSYSTALAAEVLGIGIGVGIVPAVVGTLWYLRAAAGEAGERARSFALLVLIVWVPTMLLTLYAQGGYLGGATEERYYFYAAPLLWIGAFAAAEMRWITRRVLAAAGALFVVAVAAVDVTTEVSPSYAFLAPVHTTLAHVIPAWIADVGRHVSILGTLAPRDARVFIALAAVAALVPAWRYGRGRVAVLVAAAGAQLAITAFVLVLIGGGVPAVAARTGADFAAYGWVDRHVPRATRVAWLDNQPLADASAARNRQIDATFYNDTVRRLLVVPALGRPPQDTSLVGQPTGVLAVRSDGRVTGGPLDSAFAISATDSPVLQVSGRRLAASPDGELSLLRLSSPVVARWYVRGLAGDGWLEAGGRARLSTFVAGPTRVTLRLQAPAGGATRVSVELAGRRRTVSLPAKALRNVTLDVCGPARGSLAARTTAPWGDPSAPDRQVAAALTAVRLTPAAGPC